MKHIYVGPLAGVVTGQSIAFTTFVENSKHDHVVIDINTEGKFFFSKVVLNIKVIFFLLISLIRCNGNVYFTSSRSRVGFCRDLFVIFFSKVIFHRCLINHLHGADFLEFRSSLTMFERSLLDCIYRLIDISIVLTPGMKEQYESLYPNMQLAIVPNFYQKALIDNKNDVGRFFSRGVLKVAYLSNIMKTKGIIELVAAVSELSDFLPIELVVAGKPMDDSECSAKIIANFITQAAKNYHHIKYVGLLDVESKTSLLTEADVLVLPSYYPTEAQPLCLIEGMALGCLLITTKHNYLEELIQHDINGYLVEKRSSEAIKVALEKCISLPEKLKKIQKFNVGFAKSNYSQISYVNAIDNIICK